MANSVIKYKVINVNERYFIMAFDEKADKPYYIWEFGNDFNFYDVRYIYNKLDAVKNLYRRAMLYLERVAETDISNAKLEDGIIWDGATRVE